MANLPPVSTGDPHPAAHNAERTEMNAMNQRIDARIIKPSGADVGELLRWDGTAWLPTTTRFFEGDGSPEGVVAAPVGSRYVNRLATRSEVEWVKSSGGDSNEGWTTSASHLSPKGQMGTLQITGPAATTKTGTAQLDPNIFLGVTPRQIFLNPTGANASLCSPYTVSKNATSHTIGVRHVDKVAFTTAAILTVDWFAVI